MSSRWCYRLYWMIAVLAVVLGSSPSESFAAPSDSGVGDIEGPVENAGGMGKLLESAQKSQVSAMVFFSSLHSAWVHPAAQIAGGLLALFWLVAIVKGVLGGQSPWRYMVVATLYVTIMLWSVPARLIDPQLEDSGEARTVALGAVFVYRTADFIEDSIKQGTKRWVGNMSENGTVVPANFAMRMVPQGIRGLSDAPAARELLVGYQKQCGGAIGDARSNGENASKSEVIAASSLSELQLQSVGLLGFGTLGRDQADFAAEVNEANAAFGASATGIGGFITGGFLGSFLNKYDAVQKIDEHFSARLAAREHLVNIMPTGSPLEPINGQSPLRVISQAYWERYFRESATNRTSMEPKPGPEDMMPIAEVVSQANSVPGGRIAWNTGHFSEPGLKADELGMFDGDEHAALRGAMYAQKYDRGGTSLYVYDCDQMFALSHLAVRNFVNAYRQYVTSEQLEFDSLSATERTLVEANVGNMVVASTDAVARIYDTNVALSTDRSALGGSHTYTADLSGWDKLRNALSISSPKDGTIENEATKWFMEVWRWFNDFMLDFLVPALIGIFAMLIGIWFALFPMLIVVSFISPEPWEMFGKQFAGIVFLKFSLAILHLVIVAGSFFTISLAHAKSLEPIGGLGYFDDIAPIAMVAGIGIPFLALATLGISGWLLFGTVRGISSLGSHFFGAKETMAGYAAAAKGAVATAGIATGVGGGFQGLATRMVHGGGGGGRAGGGGGRGGVGGSGVGETTDSQRIHSAAANVTPEQSAPSSSPAGGQVAGGGRSSSATPRKAPAGSVPETPPRSPVTLDHQEPVAGLLEGLGGKGSRQS